MKNNQPYLIYANLYMNKNTLSFFYLYNSYHQNKNQVNLVNVQKFAPVMTRIEELEDMESAFYSDFRNSINQNQAQQRRFTGEQFVAPS